MRTVKIIDDFDGYPSGKRRTFTAGQEVEVPNDFADLIVGKGLAKEIEPKADEPPEEKPAGRKRG